MMQGRRHKKYQHRELHDILWILETAALCPRGALQPFLAKEGVSEVLLHKWRGKYGSTGQELRKTLEGKAGKIG
jgi:hypothetical protein